MIIRLLLVAHAPAGMSPLSVKMEPKSSIISPSFSWSQGQQRALCNTIDLKAILTAAGIPLPGVCDGDSAHGLHQRLQPLSKDVPDARPSLRSLVATSHQTSSARITIEWKSSLEMAAG